MGLLVSLYLYPSFIVVIVIPVIVIFVGRPDGEVVIPILSICRDDKLAPAAAVAVGDQVEGVFVVVISIGKGGYQLHILGRA